MRRFRFYARKGKSDGIKNIVITSSMAALYAPPWLSLYAAAKAGVVGLTRSPGKRSLKEDSITVNVTCPGMVMSGLTAGPLTKDYPEEKLTPMSTILRTFDTFLDDQSRTGQVVEANVDKLHLRSPPAPSDNNVQHVGRAFTKDRVAAQTRFKLW